MKMMTQIGRIDVHSHLLPGIDDGCATLEESVACAKRMVAAGYTHSFCTPHIWPDLPTNTIENITAHVAKLQAELDAQNVSLQLIPGGEIGIRDHVPQLRFEQVVTFGMHRKFCLVDIWAKELPPLFGKSVRHLQSFGLTVILAHPERMAAVQEDWSLIDRFENMGLLLQGNLQCLDDPISQPTRQLAEKLLSDGRYFMLGSDLHNLRTLDCRLRGLERAIELVGEQKVWELTREHPLQLLGE
ncbi:MAG TPA: CpsB/CapC family capsule biosynthesis tyrosine phosphatase [Humisphaera sp.]|jgi:protein-tyrosine phosphatase|nr:CpsB/CapC family capsule biosynthesis tyrosine phosphatase [Humisphaera sp.]